jgi:hypothetical protein
MSLIGKLAKKKQEELQDVIVKAKIPEDFEQKIKELCKVNGVNQDEYLGLLLQASEINREYGKLKKDEIENPKSEQ